MPAKSGMPPFTLEIWTRIFEYAADDAYAEDIHPASENKDVPNSSHHLMSLSAGPYTVPKDIDSPTRFPYPLLATSRLFKAMLARIPSVWRRLVIYLDEDDPAATLQTYISRLERAKLEPTEILITRRNWKGLSARPSSAPSVPLDPFEEDKVQSIMEILSCRLSGATSFVIQTISGNSLPSILDFSLLDAPRLHNLVLDSLVRGTGRVLPSRAQRSSTTTVALPNIRNLTLTGPNFVALCRSPSWRKWYENHRPDAPGRFDVLRVSHFDDIDGRDTSKDPLFTLHDFFKVFFAGCHDGIGELANMSCRKLHIHDSDGLQYVPKRLILDKVSRDVVQSYLDFVTVDDESGKVGDNVDPLTPTVEFIDCTLGPTKKWCDDLALPGDTLVLKRMADPTAVKIALDLGCANAYSLWVSDCPGFDNSVIKHLSSWPAGSILSSGPRSKKAVKSKLRAIYLNNCPQVSIRGLRRFVDGTNGVWDMDEEDDEDDNIADLALKKAMERFYVGALGGQVRATRVLVEDTDGSHTLGEEDDLAEDDEGYDEGDEEDEESEEDEHSEEDESEDTKEEDETKEENEPVVDKGASFSGPAPLDEDDDNDDDTESYTDCETESDISSEDLDSDDYGPQIRLIRFSGVVPPISAKDVAWFRTRGVLLEVV